MSENITHKLTLPSGGSGGGLELKSFTLELDETISSSDASYGGYEIAVVLPQELKNILKDGSSHIVNTNLWAGIDSSQNIVASVNGNSLYTEEGANSPLGLISTYSGQNINYYEAHLYVFFDAVPTGSGHARIMVDEWAMYKDTSKTTPTYTAKKLPIECLKGTLTITVSL